MAFHSHLPPDWQSLIGLLFLWTGLFWTVHIDGLIQYGTFLLGIVFSKFIHVVARVGTSFPFYGQIAFHSVCRPPFVNPLSGDGLLSCFQFLALTNNAAASIHVQAFVWTCVFISLGYIVYT